MYALYCIIGIVMGFMFFLVIFNLIKKYYFNKVEKSSEMLKLT
jgi:hypothetical protein